MTKFIKVVLLTIVCVFLVSGFILIGKFMRAKQDTEAQHQVNLYFLHVETVLRTIGILEGCLPSDAWPIVLQHIQSGSYNKVNHLFLGRNPQFADGKDPWGNNFTYNVSDSGLRAVIRSPGPNRVDEDGKGDDIERIIDIGSERTGGAG